MQLKKSSFFGGIILLTLGLLSMGWAAKIYSRKDNKMYSSELKAIQVTVKNISFGYGKTQHVGMETEEYPHFSFGTTSIGYIAANVNAIKNDILIGDKVEIDVIKKNYDEQIIKVKNMLSSNEKTFISFYGLRANNTKYLTLENINKAQRKDNILGIYIFSLVGLIMMTFGIRKMYISIIL